MKLFLFVAALWSFGPPFANAGDPDYASALCPSFGTNLDTQLLGRTARPPDTQSMGHSPANR